MLAVGIHGAVQPILPDVEASAFKPDLGEEVTLEDFALPASAESETPETPPIEEPDVEIPPIPVIEQPIQPPEMAELVPLEDPPPAPRPVTPSPPKPRPQAIARPAATTEPSPSRGGDGSGPVTTFTGGGAGRFPYPAYPAFARSARQQGTVRLLVTVESSGVPSSVEVQSSSGFSSLDSAARDQVSRRWRWPAGNVRRFIVPVRFVLQ